MIEPILLTPDMSSKSDAFARDFSGLFLAYGLRHMNLATSNTLQSFEHVTRLLHANTHSEVIELSHDYCQTQMDILNRHASCTTDFICGITLQTAEPFRLKAILPCSVVL